ncbi:MAG: 50S ribosomal protein L28 [Candidatus Delongbacteria bacterium]|jgi:large subunit ribosomal protein L28|nr:50S ribosomal protein L28 [Candidatus Delongbacteria bacterium]
MSKICDICGKGPIFGGSVSRRGMAKKKGGVGINITGRSKRVFYPNIQTVRVPQDDARVKLKVCTSCIKAGKTIVVK